MAVFAGPDYGTVKGLARTASDLLTLYPETAGRDGYYMLYPNGRRSTGRLVYCDMTTDGGGWMLVARSHPSTVNYGGTNWGWRGNQIGTVNDFSQAYQAGWWQYWNGSSTFTSYIFGNRANTNNNLWGDFVYKVSGLNYTTFTTSDTQQSGTTSTLKSNTSVYGSTSFPGMQGAIGFANTGTNNNLYYMRDCCGYATYGAQPTQMVTTYYGSDSVVYYSGPWGGGSSTDGSGNFQSNTYLTAGNNRYGGTNQYMIMVK